MRLRAVVGAAALCAAGAPSDAAASTVLLNYFTGGPSVIDFGYVPVGSQRTIDFELRKPDGSFVNFFSDLSDPLAECSRDCLGTHYWSHDYSYDVSLGGLGFELIGDDLSGGGTTYGEDHGSSFFSITFAPTSPINCAEDSCGRLWLVFSELINTITIYEDFSNPDSLLYSWNNQYSTASLSVELHGTTVNPIPLPAALPLFLAGIAGLGFIGWRKNRRAAQQA